uniref:Uncharacterized protein n=1 Tax=Anguilla anguilla TaxID=7936 RepID=A0A0E9ULH1_ANGAN
MHSALFKSSFSLIPDMSMGIAGMPSSSPLGPPGPGRL